MKIHAAPVFFLGILFCLVIASPSYAYPVNPPGLDLLQQLYSMLGSPPISGTSYNPVTNTVTVVESGTTIMDVQLVSAEETLHSVNILFLVTPYTDLYTDTDTYGFLANIIHNAVVGDITPYYRSNYNVTQEVSSTDCVLEDYSYNVTYETNGNTTNTTSEVFSQQNVCSTYLENFTQEMPYDELIDFSNFTMDTEMPYYINVVAQKLPAVGESIFDITPVMEGYDLNQFVLFNSSWAYFADTVNSTGLPTLSNVVYLVNGTSGARIQAPNAPQYIWALAESVNTTNRLWFKNFSIYEVTNSSNVTIPFETEGGSGFGINSTALYGNDEMMHVRCGSNTTATTNVCVDSTKYGNNGTIGAKTVWTSDGLVGGAIVAQGVIGANEGNGLNFTYKPWMDLANFTFIAWIKPRSTTGGTGGATQEMAVMNSHDSSKEGDLFLGISHAQQGDVSFLIDKQGSFTYCSSGNAPVSYGGNVYQMVAATFNQVGKNMSIFYNGSIIKSCAATPNTPINVTAGGMTVLKSGNKNFYAFNGTGDEFVVYNRTLSENEIKAIYESVTMSRLGALTNITAASTVPYPTIISPTNTTYGALNVTLQVTANDTADKWRYILNGGGNVSFIPNTTFTGASGSNTLSVYVNGSSGTIQSANISFSIDNSSPVVTIIQPTNTTYGSANRTLLVTADESVSIWYYVLNSGSKVFFVPNTTVIGAEGFNNLTVFANDTFGNLGSKSVNFTIDTTSPVITIIQPQNATYSGLNRTLAVTANESATAWKYELNGNANVSFVPNTTFTGLEGGNVLKVFASDTMGNNGSASVRFTIDSISPVVTILQPQNTTYNDSYNISIEVTANERIDKWYYIANGNGPVFFLPNTTILTDEGFWNLTVVVNDTAGNAGTSSVNFTVAEILTEVYIFQPINITYGSANRTLEVGTDELANNTWWYFLNGGGIVYFVPNTTFIGVEGSNNIVVFGNQTDEGVGNETVYFTIDTIPPVVTIVNPANVSYNSHNISLNVTADSPVANWSYELNGNANVSFIPDTTFAAIEGSSLLKVFATDYGENIEVAQVVFSTDTVPPGVYILQPNNVTYPVSLLPLNVTADSVIDAWYYVLNGGVNVVFTPNITFGGLEGTNAISVYGNDTSGNTGSSTVFFTINTSSINPGSEQNFTINFSSDDAGVNVTIDNRTGTQVATGTITGVSIITVAVGLVLFVARALL